MNMTKNELIEALESAIAKSGLAKTSPGYWSVIDGKGYAMLAWECDEQVHEDMYGDEPWSEWGGNEILQFAGAVRFDDSGSEPGKQWVLWNID